jgi:hypothetical protein
MILKYFKIMKNLDYLIQKYNKPIPRYTSFPPVPYWHDVPSSKTWLESVFTGSGHLYFMTLQGDAYR